MQQSNEVEVNAYFFQPERGLIQDGIMSKEVWDPSIRATVKAIALAQLKQGQLKGGRKVLELPDDRAAAKVVWSMPQMPARFNGRVLLGGHVETVKTEKGGRRHYLTASRKGSGIIVQIDTGLYGDAQELGRLFNLMPKLADGTPIICPHGSFDLTRLKTKEESGFVSRITGAGREVATTPHSYHVAWLPSGKPTTSPSTKGEVKVFPRRKDLWVVREGGMLVTRGVTPGSIYRIINDNGSARKEAPTTDADRKKLEAAFEELVWDAWQHALAAQAKRSVH